MDDSTPAFSHGQSLDLESATTAVDTFLLNSEPHALPVEVIQRILRYTFLSRLTLTPLSDPFHLRGTTHVLLVSRAIRKLALPFFYHTVIISRPEQYFTFFDPENGLFVADDAARKRWAFVRELGVVRWERPEISPVDLPDDPEGNFLVPLRLPEAGRVKISCILDSNKYGPTSDWSRLNAFWAKQPEQSVDDALDSGLTDLEETVRNAVHRQKDHFIYRLLIRDSLSELRMSTVAAANLDTDHPLPVAVDYKLPLSIRLYYSDLRSVPGMLFYRLLGPEHTKAAVSLEFMEWWYGRLCAYRASFGRFDVMRLEGCPKELLDFIRGREQTKKDIAAVWAWKEEGEEETMVIAPHLQDDPTWRANLAASDAALLADCRDT